MGQPVARISLQSSPPSNATPAIGIARNWTASAQCQGSHSRSPAPLCGASLDGPSAFLPRRVGGASPVIVAPRDFGLGSASAPEVLAF